MNKKSLLTVMILLFCVILMADISQFYTFAQSTGTYTAITGTTVTGISVDDAISAVIPVGFTFPYGTSTYTDVKVCSNGWVALGSTQTSAQYSNALTSTTICPTIAPYWDDLNGDTATVSYLTEGTAPNRVFTVQYANAHHLGATDVLNFQTKLYENGKVEHVYGTVTGLGAATASIGINMLPGGATNYWSITPGTPATASNTVENTSISTWPGDGIKYAFNPPIPVPNDMAAMTISGNTTPTVGTASIYTIGIRNVGTSNQAAGAYSVNLMSGTTQLASVNGPAIAAGAITNVEISWTPTTTGQMSIFGKTVLTGDQNADNDQTNPLGVFVQPAGTVVVTIGAGDQLAQIPVNMYWMNSLYETIYYANEINLGGAITGVTFYNNFVTDLPNKPVNIWMGTTTLSDLSAGWVPSTQLTQVFTGTVNFPSGQNNILIPFATPFVYPGGNLVMLVERVLDTQYFSSQDYFQSQTVGTNRALSIFSDGTDYDPANPPANATLSGQFPKTSISFVVGGMGSLGGTVISGGSPLSGVTVAVSNTTLSQTTSATGTYNFPYVLPGNYNVIFTKLGYATQTIPVVITANQASTVNVTLVALPLVSVTGTVVGSDAPTVGLAGATINLTGAINYSGTANAQGLFTIPGVLSSSTYNYTIIKAGYQNGTGTITVGTTNYSLGTVILNEITLPPAAVTAVQNPAHTVVNLSWMLPGTAGGEWLSWGSDQNNDSIGTGGVADFDIASRWPAADLTDYTGMSLRAVKFFPAQAASFSVRVWTGGNADAPGTMVVDQPVTNPTLGAWNTVILNSPVLISGGQELWFGVRVNTTAGYPAGCDAGPAHDGLGNMMFFQGAWSSLLELAPTLNYDWNLQGYVGYSAPTRIASLPAIPFNYNRVNTGSLRSSGVTALRRQNTGSESPLLNERALLGYKVWRLLQGQEANEATWTLLTPGIVTDTTYADTNWGSVPNGQYKWAVKAVHTGNVMSTPSFSNMILMLPYDLAALSIIGNLTPTAEMVSNYTIAIQNTGTTDQAAGSYTVKIMNGAVELASVSGPAIAVGATLDVVVPWTPATAGPIAITGKVVHPLDTVPANNESSPYNVTVQPAGTVVVTIGAGDQLARMPLDMYYRNSMFETVFQFSEIAMPGTITGVSFYNNFSTNLPNMPTKIWLGMTALNDLSGGWISSASLTQVFDGTVNYPSGQNVITIPFTTPFFYGGTNLVMLVNRPMDTTYYSSMDQFQCQTVGTNRSLNVWSDGTNFDPAAPPVGTVPTGQFPKTSLFFTPATGPAAFGIAPAARNFGTVLMNSTNNQVFTLYNGGGGTLTINNITIAGSPMYSLQNLPTLPITLSNGQIASFTARYLPTAAGNHAATITITDDLTASRLSHPVALTGTCVDPTIYTSPYAQAFDAVTVPNLPIDWQKLISNGATSTLVTSTNTPHSTPNCVYMYNQADAEANLILISPPVTNTLPINTMRTKFWAKGAAGYTLSVGIMSNPLDAATYTEIQAITLSSVWTEYTVGFQTYTGQGHYIAYKHGLGGTYRNIFIDDALIEVTPQNDIGAISITGNSTPSVGMATSYTVNLFNWGTNPQTNYLVKLFTEGNVEVASVPGPAIQPGVAAVATISWSPSTPGATFIYGKVVLTGDQNTLNDQTPNLNITVQPAGTMVVTIGEGDQQAQVPVNMFWMNSLFETVFQATELNFIGMITGISFYNNFVTNLPSMPTKIWLGTTTQSDLSAGWIPSGQLTQVFDGAIDYPSGQNTISITLPEPFLFLEGNLVMMVQRPLDTTYYSSQDYFLCQTWGATRSREVHQDGTAFDPENPPAGTATSGLFPRTSLFVIPGGVGHLTGNVYGAGNQPLNNATVQIVNGAQTTTNAVGYYMIHNIIDGEYTVTASRYGYYSSTQNVIIPEDSTVTQNFTLTQMPTVTVTGTIVGSDAPGVGLPGATLRMTGYENYEVTANAAGVFTIPGVYVNQTYSYIASAQGYQNRTGEVIVGTTNLNMGNVILDEIAYSPRNVSAAIATDEESINLSWLAPDPNAVDITQGFESAIFPPTDWSRTVTDNGPPNTSGVYPTWCRFGEVTVSADVITPPEGEWQAGFWWSFSHQDEWLITPQFNCPQGASLTFDSNVFLGSANGDHYYVKASADNGTTWSVLWDASALTGGWNHYATPITIELGDFTGQQIKLAWHADDPNASSDGMWYVWFIDDVVVANTETVIRFPESQMTTASTVTAPSRTGVVPTLSMSRASELGLQSYGTVKTANPETHVNNIANNGWSHSGTVITRVSQQNRHSDRSLVGYKVWRLPQGQEQNEAVWTSLTPAVISVTNLVDDDWPTMTEGTYKWAVKGVYTNNVLSLAMFSNPLVKGPALMGNLAGLVRNNLNQPIMGAVVTVGALTATTAANGSYTLAVPAGSHSVTCTHDDYDDNTQNNIIVNAGLTTVLNFNMGAQPSADPVVITITSLNGNYPNPFNPETSICFDVKDRVPVRIDIYNVKGQLIRTLVNETKANGRYTAVWNGKDQHGNDVASGVYHYRMQAGEYKATRRMMLMK